MTIIGIDPGKTGYIIALSEDGVVVDKSAMPVNVAGDVDHDKVFQIIKRMAGLSKARVCLERAMPMAMGSKHAFNYGRDFKAIEIAISVSGVPMVMVEPQKWTKALFQGIDARLKPKAAASVAFERLFPREVENAPKTPKSGKILDGFVDAVLIAEYGRRSLKLN